MPRVFQVQFRGDVCTVEAETFPEAIEKALRWWDHDGSLKATDRDIDGINEIFGEAVIR